MSRRPPKLHARIGFSQMRQLALWAVGVDVRTRSEIGGDRVDEYVLRHEGFRCGDRVVVLLLSEYKRLAGCPACGKITNGGFCRDCKDSGQDGVP